MTVVHKNLVKITNVDEYNELHESVTKEFTNSTEKLGLCCVSKIYVLVWWQHRFSVCC